MARSSRHLAGWLAVAAIAQDMRAESTILDLEQRLSQAWVHGDRSFVEALLAPDWTVTDQTGQLLTKQQVLEEAFASTARRIDAITVDDVRVRLLGNVAIATGRIRATGSKQGQSISAAIRFTDVFELKEGRWQIVASQDTTIKG